MPVFKYTVTNADGKKLSGTVEAPDEKVARGELNNLGFSVLLLEEEKKAPTSQDSTPKFVFEAIEKNGKVVTGTIPAANDQEAYTKLHNEYSLTVTAIWEENASPEIIEASRQKWQIHIRKELEENARKLAEKASAESLKKQKEIEFTKTKVEKILEKVNILLKTFQNDFDKNQQSEINKRINRLLRIKHSSNVGYIIMAAQDLLEFIEKQEEVLKEKGFEEKRIQLTLATQQLLSDLKKSPQSKSISEDIVEKIQKWERKHTAEEKQQTATTKFLLKLLQKVKKRFRTPPEIQVIKDQIKVYNHHIIDFIKLYFKEPTPEYKQKVKESISSLIKARRKAVHSYRQAKKLLKRRYKTQKIEHQLFLGLIREFSSFTGWLLVFYSVYYILSLYLSTKDFGFSSIPNGFHIYESQLFKYILAILFVLHSTLALKVNFFKKSKFADAILPTVFIFTSIIIILNF